MVPESIQADADDNLNGNGNAITPTHDLTSHSPHKASSEGKGSPHPHPAHLPVRQATRKSSRKSAKAPERTPEASKKPPPGHSDEKGKSWLAKKVYTQKNSPLVKVRDLATVLASREAWDALTPEEQRELAQLLPHSATALVSRTDDERLVLDDERLRRHKGFKSDCQRYKENLRDSRHTTAWLTVATDAHRRRLAGEFDQFVIKEFEEIWDTKIPDELRFQRPGVGMSSSTNTRVERESDDEYIEDRKRPRPDKLIAASKGARESPKRGGSPSFFPPLLRRSVKASPRARKATKSTPTRETTPTTTIEAAAAAAVTTPEPATSAAKIKKSLLASQAIEAAPSIQSSKGIKRKSPEVMDELQDEIVVASPTPSHKVQKTTNKITKKQGKGSRKSSTKRVVLGVADAEEDELA